MGLTLEQRGAYSTFIDLLYASGWEEGLSDRERWFAGHLDISPRKWRAVRDELIDLGKIEVLSDGRLSDNLYRKERENALKTSRKRRESGASGGRAKAERAEKSNEINVDDLAPATDLLLYARAEREEKRREEEDITPTTVPNRAPDLIELTAKFGRAAGVDVAPNRPNHHGQQVAIVAEWMKIGLEPPEIIELIEGWVIDDPNPRHSLGYFTAKIGQVASRKAAKAKSNGMNGHSAPSHAAVAKAAMLADPRQRELLQRAGIIPKDEPC
jgi:hypothetical protein